MDEHDELEDSLATKTGRRYTDQLRKRRSDWCATRHSRWCGDHRDDRVKASTPTRQGKARSRVEPMAPLRMQRVERQPRNPRQ